MIPLFAAAMAADVQLHARGSGAPLSEIPVVIRVADATTHAATDRHGRLDLPPLDGEQTVELLPEGWQPIGFTATFPLQDELDLYLTEAEAYVVVVEAFQDSPHISRHRVDAEQALETPGVAEDSFRLVQSLPGVSVQRELSPTAGDLAIRGSSVGDNRAYLDGVEIPYLYHFNQYASVLPTSLVGELELFPSTFGAQYGDAVGGVIEARSRDERPEALHGHVNMNFWMGGASLRAPIGPRWHVAAAGRRSYQDLAGERSGQFTLWPRFHDYHARAEHTGDGGRTAVFAYGAGDRYDRAAGELDVLDPVEQAETASFAFGRRFDVVGGMHRWAGEDTGTGRVVAAIVADRADGELSSGGSERRRTTYLSSRLDWYRRITDALFLDAGWEIRGERSALAVVSAGEAGLLVAREAPALGRGVPVDDVAWRLRAGAYGQLAWSPGAWSLNPGVRIAVDTMTATLRPEPRLAVRWRADHAFELKLAAGRYHQAPETEHLLPGTGDPKLPLTGAWQLAVGFDKTFADRLELSVEAYGKRLEDPLRFPVGGTAYAVDRGAAFGIEAITRYRLLETVFLWGWVSVSRSLVDEDGWKPTEGDQPVIGGLVLSWDITDAWNVGLRYRYGSGLPYTPVEGAVYDGTWDRWRPIAGALNSARLPAYMKLDVRAAHTWSFPTWSLQLATELWFVPRSSAQLYPTYSYDYSEQGWVVGPTFFPLLSARATF